MDVLECIRSRRSIRRFKPEKVGRSEIEQLIDCARWAPSWNNCKAVRYTAVENEAELKRIAETLVAPENVRIGKDVVIEPGAVILEHVTIGDRARICAGTVVGTKSFSPARYGERAITLADCGAVDIGDDVELCANCAIAVGLFPGDVTTLGRGVKCDVMVYIGHNSHIGQRTFIGAGAKIPGNVRVGEEVWIGVNATVSNRVRIGDGARVSLGSVVTRDVPAGQTVTGNFAIDHQTFLKNLKASL